MVQNIKRVKRELVREGVIVNMYTDFMEMPDGRIAEWDFIEHKKGAAAVVAVLPDGNILMVRQYRNALDRVTLEIPAGARDSVTEDTAICAKRELEEETGYTCGKLEKLLSLKSTVAFCNEFIDVYLATELTPGKQKKTALVQLGTSLPRRCSTQTCRTKSSWNITVVLTSRKCRSRYSPVPTSTSTSPGW